MTLALFLSGGGSFQTSLDPTSFSGAGRSRGLGDEDEDVASMCCRIPAVLYTLRYSTLTGPLAMLLVLLATSLQN